MAANDDRVLRPDHSRLETRQECHFKSPQRCINIERSMRTDTVVPLPFCSDGLQSVAMLRRFGPTGAVFHYTMNRIELCSHTCTACWSCRRSSVVAVCISINNIALCTQKQPSFSTDLNPLTYTILSVCDRRLTISQSDSLTLC